MLIASSQIKVIVGLGITGLSVARFLTMQNQTFVIVDNRMNPPMLEKLQRELPHAAVELGDFKRKTFTSASEIILSPGISKKEPFIQEAFNEGVSVISDIELFARVAAAPIVAITGSNGKSTVTTLLAEMAAAAGLAVQVGGNLGIPALDLLNETAELYVLELSSFQLENTYNLNATVATVLNISEDHMDRYSSLMEYVLSKQRIYFGAEKIVVNRDDILTQPPVANNVVQLNFGAHEPDLKMFGLRMMDNSLCLVRGIETLMSAKDVKIKGRHNLVNALAALALGYAIDLPLEAMVTTLQTWPGLEHRCQFIREINGIAFYNDSKATNVGATVAAIEGFAQETDGLVLIVGGEGKGADFSHLQQVIKQHVKILIVLGKDGHSIASGLENDVEVHPVVSLQEAVQKSYEQARTGFVVLLSPACASFDMFENFSDRGNQFSASVQALCA